MEKAPCCRPLMQGTMYSLLKALLPLRHTRYFVGWEGGVEMAGGK